MKFDTDDDWLLVKNEAEDKRSKRTFIKFIVFFILTIGMLIGASILYWWATDMAIATSTTVPTLDLMWWNIIINASVFATTFVTIYYVFRKCYNKWDAIVYGALIFLPGLLLVYDSITLIFLIWQLNLASGDLFTIIAIFIFGSILSIGFDITLIWIFTNFFLHKSKMECDIVLKGTDFTVSPTDDQIKVKLNCKELNGSKMCEVPTITALKD